MDPNDQKKTACYDIDVEVDDPLKAQMSNFLASTTNQQEIASLDVKVGLWEQAAVRPLCAYSTLNFGTVLWEQSPKGEGHMTRAFLFPDPRDHRVYQPAEDPEGFHAQLQH